MSLGLSRLVEGIVCGAPLGKMPEVLGQMQ